MAAADAPRHRFGAVDSTQSIAFALADAGAADGTTVVADYQNEGRGRRGRAWFAPAGTALLASIVVRPRVEPRDLPLYSFAAALATADAIAALAGVAPRLKWPNDVLVEDRKVSGILLESRVTPPRGEAVVAIGIGLNLRQTEFPEELRAGATSLLIATGRTIATEAALDAVTGALATWRARLERDGFAPLRARWLEVADTIGRRVEVDGVAGVAVDLASDGALVIADGRVRRRVVAGEIGAHSPRVVADGEPVAPDAARR
jgi:BirA family biotin operon repressor/biotin-[acetyl-CoA-carboxylase] ligase